LPQTSTSGHATRVVGLAQHLISKGWEVFIVSALDSSFFYTNIEHSEGSLICYKRALDAGAIQIDPLHVDAIASLSTYYTNIHVNRVQLLSYEIEFLKSLKLDAICADTTSLACVAAKEAGIISILVTNFSWDFIYSEMLLAIKSTLSNEDEARYSAMIDVCRDDYGCADYYIQLPGTATVPLKFQGVALSGPLISRRRRLERSDIRQMLNIGEDVKLLVFGFGGHKSVWKLRDDMLPPGWMCLVLAATSSSDSLPSSRFIAIDYNAYIPDYIAAADAVMGKLGYGTVSECLVPGVPLIFVPRTHWPEEQFLETLVTRYSAGVKLDEVDLLSGRWQPALEEALRLKEALASAQSSADIHVNLRPVAAFEEVSELIYKIITDSKKI